MRIELISAYPLNLDATGTRTHLSIDRVAASATKSS
jgi:hypothetical protein